MQGHDAVGHGRVEYCHDDGERLRGQATAGTATAQDRARSGATAPTEPPPPTAAEILAAQPAEVREAVKEHDQKGEVAELPDAQPMCSIRMAKVRSR